MISSSSVPRATPSIPLDIYDDPYQPRRSVCFHFAAPVAHGLRDFAGQCAAKSAGAALFVAAAGATGVMASAVEWAVPVAGAVAGFDIGYKVARHQFGHGVAGRAATALCALGCATAGAAVAAGNVGATVGVAAAGFTFAVAVAQFKIAPGYEDRNIPWGLQAFVGGGALAVGGLSFMLLNYRAPQVAQGWMLEQDHVMPRQVGAMAESLGVELCKELFARMGPFVDAKGLTVEGRLVAALKGLPAYVAAGMVINRLGVELLADPQNAVEFNALAPVVLISCIPNLVRGTANTLAVLHTWGEWHRDGVPDDPRDHVRGKRAACDVAASVLDKAIVRWMLIVPRNVAFESLLTHGYSVSAATLITQGLYACYAQFRDFLPYFMAGEGWSAAH